MLYFNENKGFIMKKKKLLKLFLSTLYLSAFTFGGGYVIVTLMKKKFVDDYQWIDEKEMLDLIAIAQSSPGAIAVNGAIIVGYKLSGIIGILICIVATVIPPFVIITIVSLFYNLFKTNIYIALMLEGMQAGVGAVIASVVYEMATGLLKQKNNIYIIIMAGAFIVNYIFKINVIYIILICLFLGVFQSLYRRKKQ